MPELNLPTDGDNWGLHQDRYHDALVTLNAAVDTLISGLSTLQGGSTETLASLKAALTEAIAKAEDADDKATQAIEGLGDKVEKTAIDADGNNIIDPAVLAPIWFGDEFTGTGDTEATPIRYTPQANTLAYRDSVLVKRARMLFYCTNATASDGSTGVLQFWNGTAWKNLY